MSPIAINSTLVISSDLTKPATVLVCVWNPQIYYVSLLVSASEILGEQFKLYFRINVTKKIGLHIFHVYLKQIFLRLALKGSLKAHDGV